MYLEFWYNHLRCAFEMDHSTVRHFTFYGDIFQKLELPDEVCKICIAEHRMIFLTEDRAFRNGTRTHVSNEELANEGRLVNNVFACDWNGTYLWNIGEIVGDIKRPFDGIRISPTVEVNRQYSLNLDPSDPYYLIAVEGGWTHIIDFFHPKEVTKLPGYVK